MLCNICNLEMPIVVPALANGTKPGEHQHISVCAACFIAVTNKYMQQSGAQNRQPRKNV